MCRPCAFTSQWMLNHAKGLHQSIILWSYKSPWVLEFFIGVLECNQKEKSEEKWKKVACFVYHCLFYNGKSPFVQSKTLTMSYPRKKSIKSHSTGRGITLRVHNITGLKNGGHETKPFHDTVLCISGDKKITQHFPNRSKRRAEIVFRMLVITRLFVRGGRCWKLTCTHMGRITYGVQGPRKVSQHIFIVHTVHIRKCINASGGVWLRNISHPVGAGETPRARALTRPHNVICTIQSNRTLSSTRPSLRSLSSLPPPPAHTNTREKKMSERLSGGGRVREEESKGKLSQLHPVFCPSTANVLLFTDYETGLDYDERPRGCEKGIGTWLKNDVGGAWKRGGGNGSGTM